MKMRADLLIELKAMLNLPMSFTVHVCSIRKGRGRNKHLSELLYIYIYKRFWLVCAPPPPHFQERCCVPGVKRNTTHELKMKIQKLNRKTCIKEKTHLPSTGIIMCAFLLKQVNIPVSYLFKQGHLPSFIDIFDPVMYI